MTTQLKYIETRPPEKIETLIVFIHGFGANGRDLMNLAPYFQAKIPNCHCLAPNAPYATVMHQSYYWFPIENFEEEHLQSGLNEALPILDKFMDSIKKTYKIKNKQIILLGFSQGALLAIHHGLIQKEKYKAILSFSGGALPKIVGLAQNKTPLCIVHGLKDQVLTPEYSLKTAENMKAFDHPCELKLIRGLEHAINKEGLDFAVDFLKQY